MDTRKSTPVVWTGAGLLALGVVMMLVSGQSQQTGMLAFGAIIMGLGALVGVVGAIMTWAGH